MISALILTLIVTLLPTTWQGVQAQGMPGFTRQVLESEKIGVSHAVNTAATAASTGSIPLSLVNTINTSGYTAPSPDPLGLTYIPTRNTLLITDAGIEGSANFAGANVWEVNLDGSFVRAANISKVAPTTAPVTNDPMGVAWNAINGHFFVSSCDWHAFFDINPGADGQIGTADDTWTSFSTDVSGDGAPLGITYDSNSGTVFTADTVNTEIYEFTTSGAPVNHFDVERYGIVDPQSVEYNAADDSLFVSSAGSPLIIETKTDGTLLRSFDISSTGAVSLGELAYAPASDGSGWMNLYITDSGKNHSLDGKIYELRGPTPITPGNTPPAANAGPDLNVVLPDSVALEASVTDDGLPGPAGSVSATWSQVRGPADVIFSDPNAVLPNVSFKMGGTYVLRLSVTDGELIAFDDVIIHVTGYSTMASLAIPIASGSDDAEEATTGSITLTSSDLDIFIDPGSATNQAVGLRFNGVNIPQGKAISNAYIQFTVDEAGADATQVTIQGEAADNAPAFVSTKYNISSRLRTIESVNWTPDPWLIVEAAGPSQRTPSITAVIQEIVNRPGWASGNALVILLTGSGQRAAEAYEAISGGGYAPVLHVEYDSGQPVNTAPSLVISRPLNSATANQGERVTFVASASDAQDGDLSANITWTSSLDGALGSGASFARTGLSAGAHTITASVTDRDGATTSSSASLVVFADTNVILGAGDITDGFSTGTMDTAALLGTQPGDILTMGDNSNNDGTAAQYAQYFDPTWGRHIARMHPAPGNHDYHSAFASPFFNYFGTAVGDPGKGYYSFDKSGWHIVALNSEIDISATSQEVQWLRNDLANHPATCTLAYWHEPRFSSGATHGSTTKVAPFWNVLYEYGVDVVLNGHEHMYERFAPQNPSGNLDTARGIREFVVGTGGAFSDYVLNAVLPTSEVINASTFGVIKLTLDPERYSWQFLPAGSGTFTDSGSWNCSPVPGAPTVNPDSTATLEDTPITINVLSNDTDGEGDTLTISSIPTSPQHGTAVIQADNTIFYSPNANWYGTDSFTYKASDGTHDSISAKVTIRVDPVNDLPMANPDTISTAEDTPVSLDVLANDTDVESSTLTVSSIPTPPQHGTAMIQADHSILYTPNVNWNGTDSFTYKASDGTDESNTAIATILVDPVYDPPIATPDAASTLVDTAIAINVLTNDSEVDGYTLTVSGIPTPPQHGTAVIQADSTILYTPNSTYSGSDSFWYAISDGKGGTSSAKVNVTITRLNHAPAASSGSLSLAEDTPTMVTLVANDEDGDSLTYTIVDAPQHGSLSGTAPNLIYTPEANFHGSDSFTFKVKDSLVSSSLASISIEVSPVNDAPTCAKLSLTIDEDTSLDISPSCVDVDGDSLDLHLTESARYGLVSFVDGKFHYQPAANYYGADIFSYKAYDGSVYSDSATVLVIIRPVYDPPVLASFGLLFADEDSPLIFTANATVIDPPPASLTFHLSGSVPSGASLSSAGVFSWTPSEAQGPGSYAFSLCVEDGVSPSICQPVHVTVDEVNQAPVLASIPPLRATWGRLLSFTASASDADLPANTLTFSLQGEDIPLGSQLDPAAGHFTWTQTAGRAHTYLFNICVSDGTDQVCKPVSIATTRGGLFLPMLLLGH